MHHWTGRFPCLLKRSVMMQQKRTSSQLDDLIGSNVVANSFWATLLHVLRSSKHAACGEQMPKSQWTLPNMCWAVFDHVKFRAMTSSRSTSKTPVIIFEPFSARYIYVSICCNEARSPSRHLQRSGLYVWGFGLTVDLGCDRGSSTIPECKERRRSLKIPA